MSDEAPVETASAETLLEVGQEIRKRRGRPPGSKNKPKDDESPVGKKDQKAIFAGALVALFSLLAIILGWFGYEYYKRLEQEEAERGATYLVPIASKVGFIATLAFYLSFPIWLLTTVNGSFRKRKPETAAPTASSNGSGVSPAPSGSAVPGDSGLVRPESEPPANGSPSEEQGFTPLPPADA